VLGVSFAELGSEVARIWGLPDAIVLAIEAHGTAPTETAATPAEYLRDCAVFANALCSIVELPGDGEQDAALGMLISRSGRTLDIDQKFACRLFAAGMEKVAENAEILEVDYQDSRYCRAAEAWLERYAGAAQQPQMTAAGQASG
jgi:HD-like signal output (HDOD) protein